MLLRHILRTVVCGIAQSMCSEKQDSGRKALPIYKWRCGGCASESRTTTWYRDAFWWETRDWGQWGGALISADDGRLKVFQNIHGLSSVEQ